MKPKFKNRIWQILACASYLVLVFGCKKESENTPTVIKDGDGNIYTAVTIGTQVWLKENLQTTKLNDGTPIPLVDDKAVWSLYTTPAYCLYDNIITNKSNYGVLYNWYSVGSGKICPEGWHVPSQSELAELFDYLGGKPVAGGKLKATGTVESGDGLWHQPNTGATNASGFSALPGGYRNINGIFFDFGYSALWWASTEYPPFAAYPFWINNDALTVGDNSSGWIKRNGLSVRCLKD